MYVHIHTNIQKVRVVSAGVAVLQQQSGRQQHRAAQGAGFRLRMDGVARLLPYMDARRVLDVDTALLRQLLESRALPLSLPALRRALDMSQVRCLLVRVFVSVSISKT